MNRNRARVIAFATFSAGLLVAVPTLAAATKVNQSDWWGGVTGFPSYVNMYIYVPKSPAAKPPIVVVPHHCGGDASSSYSESSGLVSRADSVGFIMIFPEATGQNCWDAGSSRSLNHSGTGDAPAIVQMVKYALGKYSGDASRVYSVGGSSGGIMTEALLGVFPDVFTAGVSIMGVPCGCWASSYHDVTGKPSDGTGQWSSPCANGEVSKTGAAWGDLVRSYYPGYTGHRPRLQHWHGTSDTTINYKNLDQDIKEWTNLLGLSETPTGTDTPKSGTTRQFWKNSCGYTVYETFSLSGVGHSVPTDADGVATYFGLSDKATTVDPEAAACGAGGSGAGGASAGGATSVGGSTAGTTDRANGGAATGGRSGSVAVTAGRSSTTTSAGGGPSPTGGAGVGGGSQNASGQSAGGRSASVSSSALPNGGAVGRGGATAAGGRNSDTGASSSTGGSIQSSSVEARGGTVAQTGSTASAVGGLANNGGASSNVQDTSRATSTTESGQNPESGCSCTVRSSRSSAFSVAAFLATIAVRTLRRRARKNSQIG